MAIPDSAGTTYRTAVEHAASNLDTGREAVAFPLQAPVHLRDVDQVAPALGTSSPSLDQL